MAHAGRAGMRGSQDWILLGATAALVAVGLMMVFSTTYDLSYRLFDGDAAYYFRRQIQWVGIGTMLLLVASRVHYQNWKKVSIIMIAGVVVSLLVLVIIRGEKRQLIGDSVSPVEPAKLAMIVYIGHWLASKRVEQLRRLPVGALPFSIIVGIVAGLVMAQPDISEAIVIVLVAVAMFFAAGADLLQFAVGLVGGIAAFAVVILQLATARLGPFWLTMQQPLESTNDQFRQGVIALGSGGLFGMGPGSGLASHQWLYAAHTDSIFAVLGEELGLVGCLTVVGLLALVAVRGFKIARRSPDTFGALLALGITCWISIQAGVNIAVVTGTIPFSGIALPFISVGGSSLVTCMLGVGILLNISRSIPSEEEAKDEARSVRRGDGRTRLPWPGRDRSTA